MPSGDEDENINLIIGKGKKTGTALSISIRRVILDKKTEKMVVQKTEFIIDNEFDNLLMIEIFAGKFAAFHDMTTLMIDAARVGRSEMIQSILEENPNIDINAKNFKGESALISAAKSGNLKLINYKPFPSCSI